MHDKTTELTVEWVSTDQLSLNSANSASTTRPYKWGARVVLEGNA